MNDKAKTEAKATTPKRKRGRPSKAEIAARKAAEEAQLQEAQLAQVDLENEGAETVFEETKPEAAETTEAVETQADPIEPEPDFPPTKEETKLYGLFEGDTPALNNAPKQSIIWHIANRIERGLSLEGFVVETYDEEGYADKNLQRTAQEFYDESVKPSKPLKKAKKKPKAKAAPEQTFEGQDDDLIKKGSKITFGMIRYIRRETAKFFVEGNKEKGKVAAYRALGIELGLGLETVAKISRGDMYSEYK